MRSLRLMGGLGLLALASCTSVGSLGVITKSSVDPASVIGKSKTFKDLGPAEGQACRYFALAVIPWGNSDIQPAVERRWHRRRATPWSTSRRRPACMDSFQS